MGALLLAGCGGNGEPAIDGTWELATLYVDGRPVPAIAEARPVLLLDAGRANGNSGCNLYSATYRLDGNRLSFEDLVSTERACAEPERNEQEARYYDALGRVERISGRGTSLELADGGGRRLLSFRRPSP